MNFLNRPVWKKMRTTYAAACQAALDGDSLREVSDEVLHMDLQLARRPPLIP